MPFPPERISFVPSRHTGITGLHLCILLGRVIQYARSGNAQGISVAKGATARRVGDPGVVDRSLQIAHTLFLQI